jgi:hypothetical protein
VVLDGRVHVASDASEPPAISMIVQLRRFASAHGGQLGAQTFEGRLHFQALQQQSDPDGAQDGRHQRNPREAAPFQVAGRGICQQRRQIRLRGLAPDQHVVSLLLGCLAGKRGRHRQIGGGSHVER